MNTPLISAFLPVTSPPPSAGAGAGSVPDGNSFASILSGQQSQFGATQGTASASNSQSVSQQNNAAAQTGSASSNASQATQSGSNPGTGSATASSGSSGQQASSSPSGNQSTAAAQGGSSAQSSQEGASGQATNTAGTAGSQGAAQGQSGATAETAAAAAAAEQSQGALAMAGQQAASALLAGLNPLQAEAGPTDALNIDRLAATTDALSGNALAGQNANGQPGGRNAATSGVAALAGLDPASSDHPDTLSGASTKQSASIQGSATNIQANILAGRGDQTAAFRPALTGQADLSVPVAGSTAITGKTPTAAQITDTTTLTPLASALGGLAGAAAPGGGVGQGLAANGLNGAAVSRSKATLSQAASGAGAPKWGDSALSGSGKAAESTDTFLNLVNSSRLLFTAPDTPALQQAGLNTQEGATLGTLGLAQGAAGQATVPGGLGATGLPVAAAVSTPLSNPQWGTDFTRTVFNLSQTNNQGPMVAEMRLDPPDLGPIRITLTVHDNIMQAAFVSPHAVVRQTVENALPQLQQLLAQAGIALGDASVNDQGTPGQSEQAGQGTGSGAGESGTGGAGGVLAGLEGGPGTVAAAEAARGPVDPNALVDTFA